MKRLILASAMALTLAACGASQQQIVGTATDCSAAALQGGACFMRDASTGRLVVPPPKAGAAMNPACVVEDIGALATCVAELNAILQQSQTPTPSARASFLGQ